MEILHYDLEEEVIEAIGNEVIRALNPTKDMDGRRVATIWGNKSPYGLGVCLVRVIQEQAQKALDKKELED